MKAVILAAGYAVRLHPLTLKTPKPLLEVGNEKIIDRILDKLAEAREISSIYIVTNATFLNNFNDWVKGSKYKGRISIINDGTTSNENRLGAIRDLEVAISDGKICDDLLVVAGDNLFDLDLNDFLDFAKKHHGGISVALHDIKDPESAKKFGVVSVSDSGKVTDFEEKPENPKSTLVSTGIYYFPRAEVPVIGEYVSKGDKLDAPGYYINWLTRKGKVYGFTFLEDWYDIGSIESYKKADKEYLKKERKGQDEK